MNCFMPAFLLISALACSVCVANVQAPENIRDLETAFQPQDQWADPGKSSREIIVFTGEPLRIWVKKDDSTIIQIYKDSSTDWLTLQDGGQNIIKSPQPGLNNLHQEFLTEYSRACQPLTRKYLAAVEKSRSSWPRRGTWRKRSPFTTT